MNIFQRFFAKSSSQESANEGQTFILEAILTPSALPVDIDGGEQTPLEDIEVDLGDDFTDGDIPEPAPVDESPVDETPDADPEEVENTDDNSPVDTGIDPELGEELPFFDSLPEPDSQEDVGLEGDLDGDKEALSATAARFAEGEEGEELRQSAETEPTDDLEENDTADEGEPEDEEIVSVLDSARPDFTFDSGIFTVGETGEVGIDFIFDGGKYQGELAIFSLEGMDEFEPGSEEFIQEAAGRSLSDSEQGHVVISDGEEGARFSGSLGEGDQNDGDYLGVKTFNMRSGDTFGVMLVPNKTVAKVFDNPGLGGSGRPLFSMVTSNPYEGFHVGQIADVTGDGSTFVMEDIRFDGNTDADYNDIIFQVRGATGKAALMDEVLGEGEDWRETELGQGILEYVKPYVTPDAVDEVAGDLVEDVETLLEFFEETTPPEARESVAEEVMSETVEEISGDDTPVEETETVDSAQPTESEESEDIEVALESEDISGEDNSVEETETVDSAPPAELEESPDIEVELESEDISGDNNSVEETETEDIAQPTESEESEDAEHTEDAATESSPLAKEEVSTAGETTETEASDALEVQPTVDAELVARLETLTENLEAMDSEESAVIQLHDTITTLSENLTEAPSELSDLQEAATTRLVNRLEAVTEQWVSGAEEPTVFEFGENEQPLVGVIDTGFSGDNPDIDYSRITLGTDLSMVTIIPYCRKEKVTNTELMFWGLLGRLRITGLVSMESMMMHRCG